MEEKDESQQRPSEAIGRCRFSKLPARYQEIFLAGANNQEDAFFVAEKNLESVILAIPFYLLFSLIPAILMYDHQELVGDWRYAGWLPAVVVLGFGVKSIVALVRHYRFRREGIIQYGLLLDAEGLVLKEIAMLNPWCCIFVPASHIKRFYSASEGGGSGGGYAGISLNVSFLDRKGRSQSLKLASNNSLESPPYKLDKQLMEFHQNTPMDQ